MAYAFKLTAKRNVCEKGKSTVVIAKGMSFEHVDSFSLPDLVHVRETIKQRYGKEVSLSSVSSIFDVKKL